MFEKNEAKLVMNELYPPEKLYKMPLEVFKFVAQYYLTITQRNSNKGHIPQLNRIMKSYLNCSNECCMWLLTQFSSWPLLRE
jgi:hypothetical protein